MKQYRTHSDCVTLSFHTCWLFLVLRNPSYFSLCIYLISYYKNQVSFTKAETIAGEHLIVNKYSYNNFHACVNEGFDYENKLYRHLRTKLDLHIFLT